MLIGAAEHQACTESAILPPLLRRATEVYKTSCFLCVTLNQPQKSCKNNFDRNCLNCTMLYLFILILMWTLRSVKTNFFTGSRIFPLKPQESSLILGIYLNIYIAVTLLKLCWKFSKYDPEKYFICIPFVAKMCATIFTNFQIFWTTSPKLKLSILDLADLHAENIFMIWRRMLITLTLIIMLMTLYLPVGA